MRKEKVLQIIEVLNKEFSYSVKAWEKGSMFRIYINKPYKPASSIELSDWNERNNSLSPYKYRKEGDAYVSGKLEDCYKVWERFLELYFADDNDNNEEEKVKIIEEPIQETKKDQKSVQFSNVLSKAWELMREMAKVLKMKLIDVKRSYFSQALIEAWKLERA
jgi:hypothetical protein